MCRDINMIVLVDFKSTVTVTDVLVYKGVDGGTVSPSHAWIGSMRLLVHMIKGT